MARKRSLSAREVDSIKASGVHWVAPSLYMKVRPENGTRSWLFRCSIDGKNQWIGLGSCRDVKLSDARDEADQLRIGHRRGVNPLHTRTPVPIQPEDERAATAPTFRECAEAYLASHAPTWKNDKHIAGWERSLADYAGPVMGSIPVDKITVDHVMKVVEPIWLSKPETARRTLSRIEHVIAWAIAAGHRPGDNPATRDAVRYLLPKANRKRVRHHPAVPVSEMPALMKELEALNSTSSKALQWTILTACRTSETLGADWSEIDLEKKLWTIPADRMKTGKEHVVPLSTTAISLLEVPTGKGTGLLFPGPKGRLGVMAMLQCLRGLREGSTVHGMRSTFRDWCAEQGISRELAERALAHIVPGVEGAYLRSGLLEQRRPIMQAWADYCTGAGALMQDVSSVASA
jgi:integrase